MEMIVNTTFIFISIIVVIASASNQQCLTSKGPNSGKPCVFPFIYKGVEHKACTKHGWHKFWCAAEVKANGEYSKFGYCDDNACPKECGKPERKGDGWCDDDNNFETCEFDGGDCCFGKMNYCKECQCKNRNPGCEIDLDQRSGDYPPLILDFYDNIKYPVGSRILTFGSYESLSLFCHGTDRKPNYIDDAKFDNPSRLQLICKSGKFFFNGDSVLTVEALSKISCKRIQEPEIIRETESDCSKGLGADGRTDAKEKITLVKVGWKFDDKFVEQWSACIDEKIYATLWTKHVVHGQSIEFRDVEDGRPSFRVDARGYTGKNQRFFTLFTAKAVSDAYKKANQVESVKKLLGTDNKLPDGTPIIETHSSGTNYFARGHLSPDAAFIEGPEQDATYFFFNVAPQFQSFNNGNWKQLEEVTREMAEKHNGSVTVYSGTYGILEYPNDKNENTPIFILEDDGNWYIPAPKYYWKILLNEVTKEVSAFVGLNDPHADDIPLEDAFCTTSCSNIGGVDWSVEDESKGRMSCCTIQDLKDKIGFIPDIPDIYQNDQDLLDEDNGSNPISSTSSTPTLDSCNIDLESRTGKYAPLILKDNAILYPEGSTTLSIGDKETITLFCHGTEKRENGVRKKDLGLGSSGYFYPSIEVKCENKEFFHEGTKIEIEKMYAATCRRIQEPLIIREEKSDCSNGLGADGRSDELESITLVKVGWKFSEEFEEQWRACIDEKVYGTLWTHHSVLGKSIDFRYKEPGRPSFRTDARGYKRFFTFTYASTITKSYSKKNQVQAMEALLGTNKLSNGEDIIENSKSGTNYFAKGHLSPDAAFIEGPEQDATYFFFNVAPQFQSFNNGNWKALEYATRNMAESIQDTVKVWSGTYGLLSYPDVNGNDVDIYIYVKNGKKYIPAPKYYWKVIQNGVTGEAVAFVGLNDPHSKDILEDEGFCNSICNTIEGVEWDFEEESKGHMVCCTVQELREKIPFAPDLGNSNLDNDITQ